MFIKGAASGQFIWLTRLAALLLVFTVWLTSLWIFLIQPMVARIIVPRFGGGPEVWTTAMNAFALASCPGLLCAWLLSLFREKRWSIGLIATAFILLLIYFASADQRPGDSLLEYLLPFCAALGLLFAIQVLLPFWFGQAAPRAWVDPYFVLAFAHLGTMMSVIGYPLLIEPNLTTGQQNSGWIIGFAAIGVLFLACTWLLDLASSVSSADGEMVSVRAGCPTWLRRFRWTVLGGVPTLLLAHGPPLPALPDSSTAPLHLVLTFELTLVVAYVRLPWGKPSRLSWVVQILAVLTAVPSLMALAGNLSDTDTGKLLCALALLGAIASALVPHRWTLMLQALICLIVIMLNAVNLDLPAPWLYLVHFAVVAVAGWGCFGEMLADRPGPERLPEFLFFTGFVPSALFVFLPAIMPLITPRVAYPAIVVLTLLARFLPGKNAHRQEKDQMNGPGTDHRTDPVITIQPVLDTCIRVSK